MKLAAWMMYLSAALHFVAPLVSGATPAALGLLPFGVMWGVIGWLLVTRGWRWLAWAGFGLAGLGGIAMLIGVAGVAPWVTDGIAVADGLAALALFGVLWGEPERVPG